MLYLTTHSTHFIYGYMASRHIVKDHLDSETGNSLPPHRLLFPISSKGSFICTSVVEHWLERQIAQWVHHEGSSEHSYPGATSRSLCEKGVTDVKSK